MFVVIAEKNLIRFNQISSLSANPKVLTKMYGEKKSVNNHRKCTKTYNMNIIQTYKIFCKFDFSKNVYQYNFCGYGYLNKF